MFKRIMVPVDLEHLEHLGKAMTAAADLSRHYSAPVWYVGVTAATPGPVAHNPTEFQGKLDELAAAESGKHGHQAHGHTCLSHDPSVDIDKVLMTAVESLEIDLVVMASHRPTSADYLLPSHGGHLAAHAGISVFLVR